MTDGHCTDEELEEKLSSETLTFMYDRLDDAMGVTDTRDAVESVVGEMVNEHDHDYPADTMGITLVAFEVAKDVVESQKDDAGRIADSVDGR